MALKQTQIDGIGKVYIGKYKNSKSIRITLQSDGKIKVSIPNWVPYRAAEEYLKTKKTWIEQNIKRPYLFHENQLIGKYSRIIVNQSDKASVRLQGNNIVVKLPSDLTINDPDTQSNIQKTAYKTLKKQSEQLVTKKFIELSARHGFEYKSLSYKRLKSRWGSCSSENDITLNIFLINLDWDLIEYVILHELTHTRFHHHKNEFWDNLTKVCPNAKLLAKKLKNYSPFFNT